MISELIPRNIVVEGDKVWFVPNNIEGIFYMDINSNKCLCISDEAIFRGIHDFATLGKYENYLILTTWCRDGRIVIFDIHSQKIFSTIDMNKYGICIIDNIVVKDSTIYLINNSSMNPGIFVMDGKTFDIIDMINLNYGFSQESMNINSPMRPFSNDYIKKEDCIILAATLAHLLIEVNLSKKTVKYTEIDCSLSEFVAISYDGNSYWIMDENARIIKWDEYRVSLEMDLQTKIENLKLELNDNELAYRERSKGYRTSYMFFNNSFYYKNKVFWLPGRTNQIVYVACDDLSVGSVNIPEHASKMPMVTTRIASFIIKDDKIILFTTHDNIMAKIGLDNFDVEMGKLICQNRTEKIKVKYETSVSEKIVFPYRLQDYLEQDYLGMSKKEETCGEQIYKFL